ncbi:Com family DNA-binding transcriptional regulator [Haemophilus influenzae]|nr:Com family DNA-binding transcriptional regulator [Haemophilus influenzae]
MLPATQIVPAYSHTPPTLRKAGGFMQSIKAIRCTFCNKLLAKVGIVGYLEIKCPRCKTVNTTR